VQYHIVRSRDAGVFFGVIRSRKDSTVSMTDVRRLWYWRGAASLSQMANEGVKFPDECKFGVAVASIEVLGVCEILEATNAAAVNILAVPEWRV